MSPSIALTADIIHGLLAEYRRGTPCSESVTTKYRMHVFCRLVFVYYPVLNVRVHTQLTVNKTRVHTRAARSARLTHLFVSTPPRQDYPRDPNSLTHSPPHSLTHTHARSDPNPLTRPHTCTLARTLARFCLPSPTLSRSFLSVLLSLSRFRARAQRRSVSPPPWKLVREATPHGRERRGGSGAFV